MTKFLFIDRDGTLIKEPEDFQIDSVRKFSLLPGVISSLKTLSQKGYRFVMVSNQDGLGTKSYSQESFDEIQNLLISILESEGIFFEDILICPHFEESHCECRKPKTSLVFSYLARNDWDRGQSYVIGDRETDAYLARNMGLSSFILSSDLTWEKVTRLITDRPRSAVIKRKSTETDISLSLFLEGQGNYNINTGLGFFDHMLEQLARHSGMDLTLTAKGDLHVDQHHLIEDVALALGSALAKALGDKRGIARYSFWLPMDESSAKATVDLSGRPSLVFDAEFSEPYVGGLSVQMIKHFFKSLCDAGGVSLHLEAKGENTHHMVEGLFKVFGKILGEAIKLTSGIQNNIPSTKGLL